MKKQIYILLVLLLAVVSCEGLYYMPFTETEEGKDAASLYIDGEPFRTQFKSSIHASRTESLFNMKFLVSSELHDDTRYEVTINIVTDADHPVEAGKQYPITEQPGSDPATYPQITLSLDHFRAEEGYLTFRCYGDISAGNFETVVKDVSGNAHVIRYGNFDVTSRLD